MEIQIRQVKDLLERASSAYYNTDSKLLTDEEFDQLKDYYEKETGEVFSVGAPPESLGEKGVINVSHSYENLVGTLHKTNTVDEAVEYFVDKIDSLNIPPVIEMMLTMTLKFDGNSITGEYDENGKLIKMLTRGRNGKGLDLTHIFEGQKVTFRDKKPDGEFAVKYEAIVTYTDFEEIQKEKNIQYANPRSLVSGLLGRDDARDFIDYITLVPLAVKVKKETSKIDEEMFLLSINNDDLITNYLDDHYTIVSFSPNVMKDSLKEEFTKMYEKWDMDARGELDYMIDGLVLELLSPEEYVKELGYLNDRPRFATALKFPYMEKRSTVTGMKFYFGKTGRITPVVQFEPVEFNGAIQKQVSLSNYKRFKELELGIGSPILVEYRNDVLSYVQPIQSDEKFEPIPFIEECPECGEEISISHNEVFAFCKNDFCPGKLVGRIERYLTVLDIKGIKGGTLEKLYNAGLINNIVDLYTLDNEKASMIPGLGEKSVEIIDNALNIKDKVYDYELLAGIGIKNVNIHTSKILMKEYTLDELLKDNYYDTSDFQEEVIKLEGFQWITVTNIVEGLKKYSEELKDLIELDQFEVISYKEELAKNKSSKSYTFCITGSLNNWKNRKELQTELELKGHKVTGGVSKNTDYLINNDPDSTSSKNKKAKELGVPIVSEEFIQDKFF